MKDQSSYEFRVEDKTSIHSVNILSKSQEIEVPLIYPKKREEITSSLVNNNIAELAADLLNTNKLSSDSYFLNCMIAYSYIFPDSQYSDYSILIRKNINDALGDDIRMNEMILGLNYTKGQFDKRVGGFLSTEMLV